MLTLVVWGMLGVGFVSGFVGLMKTGFTVRRRRRLQARLGGGTAALEDGAVATVTGIARSSGDLLEAPLSGRACVFYEVHVRLFQHQKNQVASRLELVGERRVHELIPFVLDTDDGPVIIDGDTAETSFVHKPLIPRALDRERRLLRRIGTVIELANTSTFEEVVVEPGQRIAVRGMAVADARSELAGETGYRDVVPRFRIVTPPDHPLTIGPARRT